MHARIQLFLIFSKDGAEDDDYLEGINQISPRPSLITFNIKTFAALTVKYGAKI